MKNLPLPEKKIANLLCALNFERRRGVVVSCNDKTTTTITMFVVRGSSYNLVNREVLRVLISEGRGGIIVSCAKNVRQPQQCLSFKAFLRSILSFPTALHPRKILYHKIRQLHTKLLILHFIPRTTVSWSIPCCVRMNVLALPNFNPTPCTRG